MHLYIYIYSVSILEMKGVCKLESMWHAIQDILYQNTHTYTLEARFYILEK